MLDRDREAPSPEIEYPESDGRPMSETDLHWRETVHYVVEPLRDFFRSRSRVYVGANNFIYYVKGDPRSVVSPDCYVVKGVAKGLRDTFKVWEEGGKSPCFVLEVTSKKTKREDQVTKLAKYRDALRVPEYFLFDPRREWVGERLRGLRLMGEEYRPIAPLPNGRVRSRELGLELADVGGHLRFFVPGASAPIPTLEESRDELRRELARLRARRKRGRGKAR